MQAETLQNQNIAEEAAEFLKQEQLANEASDFLQQEASERSSQRDDTETWCAEVLDGSMRTEFTFAFDGKDIWLPPVPGKPPVSFFEVFDNSIKDAEKLAESNPFLAFELRRRKIEGALDQDSNSEYQDMLAMMRGELPNTMIVISDFPEELMAHHKNVGGYNVLRKQTMQRTIIRNIDATITIRTQSLDRSDRGALEDVYRSLGEEPKDGELLGQRIFKNLNKSEQDGLQDQIRATYDRHLSQKFGGEWYAGRKPAETANTFDFVRRQSDLIDAFIFQSTQPDLNKTQLDRLHYNLAAAMEARWEGRAVRNSDTNANAEMLLAGQEAMAGNKTFSGCGMTIELNESGFGNKTEEMHCPFCRKKQIGDPCSPNQKCVNKDCEAEVRGGKVVYEGHGKTKKFGEFLVETFKSESNN